MSRQAPSSLYSVSADQRSGADRRRPGSLRQAHIATWTRSHSWPPRVWEKSYHILIPRRFGVFSSWTALFRCSSCVGISPFFRLGRRLQAVQMTATLLHVIVATSCGSLAISPSSYYLPCLLHEYHELNSFFLWRIGWFMQGWNHLVFLEPLTESLALSLLGFNSTWCSYTGFLPPSLLPLCLCV